MATVQYVSPLAVRGPVPLPAGPLAEADVLENRERHYVVDSVKTTVFCSGRGKSIIPPYDASQDPAARAFFQRQVTQAVVALTRHGQVSYLLLKTKHFIHSPQRHYFSVS